MILVSTKHVGKIEQERVADLIRKTLEDNGFTPNEVIAVHGKEIHKLKNRRF